MARDEKGRRQPGPRLVLFIGVIGISCSSILVRWSDAPSLVLAALRMLWVSLILTPAVLARNRAELKVLARKDFVLCCLAGVLLGLHFATWFEAVNRTTIASAGALGTTSVIFTALGYAIFLKGRIPRLGVAAIAITFAGAVVTALGGGGEIIGGGGDGGIPGSAFAICTALLYACYTLLVRVIRGRVSTAILTWLAYLSSTVTLVALCLASGESLFGWGARNIVASLLLALVATLMGHSLISYSLRFLAPTFVSNVLLLEPVIATVIAFVAFREVPTPLQAVGGIVILLGVLLFSRVEQRAQGAKDVKDVKKE